MKLTHRIRSLFVKQVGGLPPSTIMGRFMSAMASAFAPGSLVNYRIEVGELHLNEVVLPAINYKYRAILAPKLELQMWSEKKGDWETASPSQSTSALKVLRYRNAQTDYARLLHRLLLGYDIKGNAFFYKVRSQSGKVVALQWLDSRLVTASNSRDINQAITHWEYQTINGLVPVELTDMVHIKFGADPDSEVFGLSPLASALRAAYISNSASNWNAATIRNQGKPSAIVSPKTIDGEGFSPDTVERTKDYLSTFVADKRGEMAFLPIPVDIMVPGWKPSDLELLALSRVSRETILSHLGVPGEVLSWETANKTYNNAEQADDSVGKRTILPMLEDWAEQLSFQILPELGIDPSVYRYHFNTKNVSWLIDDEDKMQARHRENFKVGGLTVARFKEKIGETPNSGDDKLTYFDLERGPNQEKAVAPKSGATFLKRDTATYDAQRDHDRTIKRAKNRLQTLVQRLADENIEREAFKEAFSEILFLVHKDLHVIGQRHAGISSPDVEVAELVAQQITDLEQQYVDGLITDVLSDLYKDDDGIFQISHGGLQNRLQWYAAKASGTASQSFVDASDDDEEFDWDLGGIEDHCQDCPYIAENSPYTKDTLYATPRGGQTPCGGSCKCSLKRRSDSKTAFKPLTW